MSLFLSRGPIGICDRCKTKKYLNQLKPDGDNLGLRVCPDCWDQKDPYKLPQRQTEDISLRVVRPDEPLT
jgi:hypothetical protein